MYDHKGPGKPDDVPKDGAGETYYDRVRNVNAQLEAMEGDFLAGAAEWQREEREKASADEAPADEALPPADDEIVSAAFTLNREGLATARKAWFRVVNYGPGDLAASQYLLAQIAEPVLNDLCIDAREKGWFKPDE